MTTPKLLKLLEELREYHKKKANEFYKIKDQGMDYETKWFQHCAYVEILNEAIRKLTDY